MCVVLYINFLYSFNPFPSTPSFVSDFFISIFLSFVVVWVWRACGSFNLCASLLASCFLSLPLTLCLILFGVWICLFLFYSFTPYFVRVLNFLFRSYVFRIFLLLLLLLVYLHVLLIIFVFLTRLRSLKILCARTLR